MVLRRAFFYWQTAAALVLPVWLLIGWGIWGTSAGELLGVAITAPILVVALLIVVGLTIARRSVREKRAVSWLDVGVLTFWHAMLIGLGFFGPAANWFAVFAVIGAIVAFWSAVWQLIRETRRRVQAVFDEFQRVAAPQGTRKPPVDAGEYIVLPPSDDPR
ncbi:hypothetical protein [Herbiconiux sp. L3-i23]|uniref:hypothetical protein n=1 Tax=Herbiconiux sp. L3-i23 TaxID=2905871 RepID=UPI0020591E11|nr:hypothetical protein [Herbiconiux sp. L3-i23]BDI21907.1 hypothetical protein L3i23_06830 [Herbiconiux sp. L3-i23]